MNNRSKFLEGTREGTLGLSLTGELSLLFPGWLVEPCSHKSLPVIVKMNIRKCVVVLNHLA